RALFGCEHAGLPFKAEDRTVYVWLAGQHAGIVYEIAGGEVVGAVSDDVEFAEEFKRIFAGEARFKLADLQKRIDRLEFLYRGVQLLASDVRCRVNDLALQIGVIHHVKIDNSQSADTGRGQVQGKWRAQASCADTQDLRRL